MRGFFATAARTLDPVASKKARDPARGPSRSASDTHHRVRGSLPQTRTPCSRCGRPVSGVIGSVDDPLFRADVAGRSGLFLLLRGGARAPCTGAAFAREGSTLLPVLCRLGFSFSENASHQWCASPPRPRPGARMPQ